MSPLKYLVINRRNAVPIPPEQAATLFQAAKLWLKTRQAEGGIDGYYVFSDTEGGLTISNADSNEEVYDHILDFPLYMFFDWEVQPLCDGDHAFDKLIKVVDTMFG